MKLLENLHRKILDTDSIWLFLDYDGTLADFAPTPDIVIPDPSLIRLLQKLADHPKIDLTIISGRRLSHIIELVPIKGIWLAGSYGLELRNPLGEFRFRMEFDLIRPILEGLKPIWAELIGGEEGFYLEDKGWSLALHARFAPDEIADRTITRARLLAEKNIEDDELQLLGGHKFLEIAPKLADKGKTIAFFLDMPNHSQKLPIFIGDDDKDEKAFPVVQAYGGITGHVSDLGKDSGANFQLKSPHEVRAWLRALLKMLD